MWFVKNLSHSYSHRARLRRYLEIIDLLIKFGFSDLVNAIHDENTAIWQRHFQKHSKRRNAAAQVAADKSRPVRVRLLLEALGPTFVKLGQVLSARPDLIPIEYASELSHLQDRVPGFPGELAVKIVEAELKRPINEIFSDFTVKPLAAASIGQVHKAVLPDGQEVIVKVQRPGICDKVEIDLDIMSHIAEGIEHSDSEFAFMRPGDIVEEFSHVLRHELNYMIEATHALRFAADMKEQPGIYAPQIYMDYTTGKVLTMELIQGDSCKDVLEKKELQAKYDLPLLAREAADAVMAQIFKYGFFHADPHPGNIFLLENNVVCFIDFGMMGRITELERGYFIDAVKAILDEDFLVLTRTVRKLATESGTEPNWELLERDLGDMVQENLYLPLDKLSLAHILEQLMRTMSFHKLALRPNLFVMFKALMTIENVARAFDPKLSILNMLQSAMRSCQQRRFKIRKRLEALQRSSSEWLELGGELPGALRKVIHKISDDSLVIKLEHHRLAPLENSLRYASDMLSEAIIFAALLLSASLVVLSKIPPLWHGVPVLGVIGYLLTGCWAVIIMIRKRRRH